jgi:anaerobic magnesium-protoporphyrin IX monomethyl ester cyclase
MKILFIYPGLDSSYPIQLGYLSAYVKAHGHQVQTLPLVIPSILESTHLKQISQRLLSFRPDFIGFSCYETSLQWNLAISNYAKKILPKTKIIFGGYFPTLNPQETINNKNVDIVCIGEGEKPLLNLLNHPRSTRIPSLWIKKAKKVFRNPVSPLTVNIDRFPFPDREMFDYQNHLNLESIGQRTVKVIASRGCPYQCTYCSNYYLRSVYPNQPHYFRLRSVDNVIQEILELKSTYQFEQIGFHDDNLTLDPNWLSEFTRKYRKLVKLPFYCATRVEQCSLSTLKLLKSAGCNLLLIGIESGNEQFRTKMMKRFMSNSQILTVFHQARKLGLKTWSFTMVGLPYETPKLLFDTIKLNWQCRPDFVMASIFYPLRGTELGDLCYKQNWVNVTKKTQIHTYAWESILNHPHLSSWQIKLAKYLNAFTALRSPLFWSLIWQRLKAGV